MELNHNLYCDILQNRGLSTIKNPIWKMEISDEEYQALKDVLVLAYNEGRLMEYNREAAIYYAEWWRREYVGGIPSKEDVANSLGICDSEGLYKSARTALRELKFRFISGNRIEYFRTMLSQGGIPINYIKSGSNLSSYRRFLGGLVRELSAINYDWNICDPSIVERLSCVSYLASSFHNSSIYDVSLQIARAIICEDDDYLPYDSSDKELADLTISLKKEYSSVKRERKAKPLSINWKLRLDNAHIGCLLYNLDIIKEISSDSIPGLDTATCYKFDVLVSGVPVATYSRLSLEYDEDPSIVKRAIYRRITVGVCNDFLWNGESMVEVKLRCDNDQRIFLSIPGCYAPDFGTPQIFQKIEGSLYIANTKTANTQYNIAIFSTDWECENSDSINIADANYLIAHFAERIEITNKVSNEIVELCNDFTPYSVEYRNIFVDWIESSNYKICTHRPSIRVYDADKNPVGKFKSYYRIKGSTHWSTLPKSDYIPTGLIEIKTIFPDGRFVVETFYSVGDLQFTSSNEHIDHTTITCENCDWGSVELEQDSNLDIENIGNKTWHISRAKESNFYASTIYLRIYKANTPTLRLEIPIPFSGVNLVTIKGEIVPDRKIISYSNLQNFKIVCHSGRERVAISYSSNTNELELNTITISRKIRNGITSLSDYTDLIDRMLNLYGDHPFSRDGGVIMSLGGKLLTIRKFVLDSTIDSNIIEITDDTTTNTTGFVYSGELMMCPIAEAGQAELDVVEMERLNDDRNSYSLPDDYEGESYIVFSNAANKRRIVPKMYKRNWGDFSVEERKAIKREDLAQWLVRLQKEDIFTGNSWKLAYKSFSIASLYRLPFRTFNSLSIIASHPDLLANFILGMWYYRNEEVLLQCIEQFEQEYAIGIHWIKPDTWAHTIERYFAFAATMPNIIQTVMYERFATLFASIKNIFTITLGFEAAEYMVKYISGQAKEVANNFSKSEIREICAKIIGASDDNRDLPTIKMRPQQDYYSESQMPSYYRVMLETPMCEAENIQGIDNSINLWDYDNIEFRKIANFYRLYFKESYSMILTRTISLLNKQKQ